MNRIQLYKKLGFSPNVVFDGGAFIGSWARNIAIIFPECKIVLIEPNSYIHNNIRQNLAQFPQDRFMIAPYALGDVDDKKVELNVWQNSSHEDLAIKLAGSSLLDHVQGDASQKVECTMKTLDTIMELSSLKPDLIKLDLQGFEKFALAGADEALKHAQMCIVEFGCLDAYKERTTPADLFEIMTKYGYVLYDIFDMIYRPYDNGLCGGDFVFVKKDHKLREHKDFF